MSHLHALFTIGVQYKRLVSGLVIASCKANAVLNGVISFVFFVSEALIQRVQLIIINNNKRSAFAYAATTNNRLIK